MVLELMEVCLQKVLIFALLLSLILPPLSLRAAEPSTGEDLGYGFGSVVASLFYSPLKITYAGLGLMTGGLGYLLSAGKAGVADKIIYPAVYGNYIITPSHLKGAQPLVFIGPPPPTDPIP